MRAFFLGLSVLTGSIASAAWAEEASPECATAMAPTGEFAPWAKPVPLNSANHVSRFRRAQNLLAEGASVKQAAYAVGFASPSNFATAFQREVGCAPSAYRARHFARVEA